MAEAPERLLDIKAAGARWEAEETRQAITEIYARLAPPAK